MNQKLSKKHEIMFFTFLCCLVYFTSYLTRLNYTASLSEICDSLSINRQSASLPITGCFIVYGIGQFICGILGDKISPRNMISGGLLISSVCNISVAMTSSITMLTTLWCINGFAQSMIWPPLVRIMAGSLHEKAYQRCCIAVAGASSAGTILVYFLVPICVTAFEWRTVFILSAVSGILNAATYVGSALSTYIIAGISEKFGWYTTILCWTVLALAGLITCSMSVRKWSCFLNDRRFLRFIQEHLPDLFFCACLPSAGGFSITILLPSAHRCPLLLYDC